MKRIGLLLIACCVPAAQAAFKCVDEKGKSHVGDTPPEACAKVEMLEVSRSGTVLRRIPAPLTPEQLRQKEEDAQRKKEADKVAAEQKRKDMALLNTFSGEREFDVVRDRNIEPVQGRIRVTQERLREIDKRLKTIAEEMEFYKAGKKKGAGAKANEPPPMLVQETERLGNEKQVLNASIARAEKEIVEIRERFDADKQRWIALKAAERKGSREAKTSTVVPAGETKAVTKKN
jgi:hypothetical protein